MTEKRPVGRPKVQLADLPSDWKERIIVLSKQGASAVELRVALDCMSDDLWYRLIDEEPEFSLTVKKCNGFCQAWWEENGRTNLHDRDFSATLWYMNMKNRFGWADKKEVKTEHSGEVKGINYIVPNT